MQVHIALYRWKDSVDGEAIRQILNKVKALQNLPGIIDISWGENTSPYSEGYTHVILVRGEDQAAIEAYRKHPDHVAVAKIIEAMGEHGIGVDFTPA